MYCNPSMSHHQLAIADVLLNISVLQSRILRGTLNDSS